MRRSRASLFAIIMLAAFFGFWYGELEAPVPLPKGAFVAKPYLQLGEHGKVAVVWQTPEDDSSWKIEYKIEGAWKPFGKLQLKHVEVQGLPPFRIYRAESTIYDTNGFDYQILRDEDSMFRAHANPRMNSETNYSFAVFGDGGAKSDSQRSIAYQLYKSNPNFLVIVGDIVYDMGRAREYLSKFFPIYNCDEYDFAKGAPLMRSIMFVGASGNHDTDSDGILPITNLDELSDGMAYFYEWSQPLNGPASHEGINTPKLTGSEKHKNDFLIAAKSSYPRAANFYFDKGNARFVILDSNSYMDWTQPEWRKWLRKTLSDAKAKTWRFVFFHQTAFSSDTSHSKDQQMRVIADILQSENVQLAFSGHSHSYQRTYPLQFTASGKQKDGVVGGQVMLAEKPLDPAEVKNSGYVTYITTGAGGQTLTGGNVAKDPKNWQPFTKKFVANVHSYSMVQVQGEHLVFRQISEKGDILDEFHMIASGIITGTGSGAMNVIKPEKTAVPVEPFPAIQKHSHPKKTIHHHKQQSGT